MDHPDPQLFSALLEGRLAHQELEELQHHLTDCAVCSGLLQDLQKIRRQAGELPDHFPRRDLWPGIAQAIREDENRDPDVIHLHRGARIPGPLWQRGFHLSIPQAVAAGLALALVSGLAGARIGPGHRSGDQLEVASQLPSSAWVTQVGEANPALEATALEVARLEQLLAEHGEELDTYTSEILEKNLGVIDKAIRESVGALTVDPGNRFLKSNLERAVLAKGEYLRDATLLVAPIS